MMIQISRRIRTRECPEVPDATPLAGSDPRPDPGADVPDREHPAARRELPAPDPLRRGPVERVPRAGVRVCSPLLRPGPQHEPEREREGGRKREGLY